MTLGEFKGVSVNKMDEGMLEGTDERMQYKKRAKSRNQEMMTG